MDKKALRKAFVAGFIACVELPEKVELIEGSVEQTMDALFENWINNASIPTSDSTHSS